MKKAHLLLGPFVFCLILTLSCLPQRGSKSNPFGLPLEKSHFYELLWDNGQPILGVGVRSTFGFPCQAMILDTGSLKAAEAQPLTPGKSTKVAIDSWRIKLDLVRLTANIAFAALVACVLNKAIRSRPANSRIST